MLVNSVSSFNPSKSASLKQNQNGNGFQGPTFAGVAPIKAGHHKNPITIPVALMLAVLGVGAAASCTQPNNPIPTTPTTPTEPVITQSPVQISMLSALNLLGLTSSTKDVTNFSYSDGINNTKNELSLNTSKSTDSELVYDGTSFNQDFETTSFIRHKITKSGDGIIVEVYKTMDENPPSDSTIWMPNQKYKYIKNADATAIEKYSINSAASTEKLLATISPDSPTSLIATTGNGDIYPINDISITTK